jgi:hypothetical protein
MKLKRFIDGLQVSLYLVGAPKLAQLVGLLGTPALEPAAQLPGPVVIEKWWTTEDWRPAEPLVIVDVSGKHPSMMQGEN